MALQSSRQAHADRLRRILNGRRRDELPNETLFRGLDHAGRVIAGHFPPDKAWPAAIAEAGYWTALMTAIGDVQT